MRKKNSTKLKVGIVGFGVVGKKRFHILRKYKNIKISAISDISIHAVKQIHNIQYFKNYRDLITSSNCDIIFVSLPNKFAAHATKLALSHNKHVFCEKPPARSSQELRSIQKLLINPKLKLKYGFNHRYHSSVIKASNIINSNELGAIVAMRGIYGKSKIISFDQTDWRSQRAEAGGGILLDQGIHMLDLMLYFAEEQFNKVFSIVKNDFWNHDVEDNAFALMETPSGIVAQLHSSATQWRHKFNLEIILERGALVFGGLLTGSKSYGEETLTVIKANPESDKGLPKEKTYKFIRDISWAKEIREFIDAITDNQEILHGTYEEAITTMRLIEKIYKADKLWAKKYYNS